jgi:hypothetical protein
VRKVAPPKHSIAVKITFCKFLLLSGFAAMGSWASATPVNIDCAGPGTDQVTVPDVTGLEPDTCSVIGSSLVFGNFGVTSTDSTTPTIGIASPSDGTGVVGSDTNLVFQITSGEPGLDDTFLTYEVTGAPVVGLDMNFEALPLTGNGSVTVTEVACSSAFVSDACLGTSYADFSATSICVSSTCTVGSNAEFLIGGAEDAVYIQKDIAFSGANITVLENSHFSSVPEPVSAYLMAAGLGLGLVRRRRINPS